MSFYELSFTPTFYNESLSLPRQVSKLVGQKLKILAEDPFSVHGDAKKLKGYTNVYRARVGDYRVFYSIGQGWIKLLSVRKRDERTYEDDLPDVAPPAVTPNPELLAPQVQPTISWEGPPSDEATDSTDPPAEALPYPITTALLTQWQIPSDYHALVTAVHTADDLLELAIPERYISRVLDNLFPRTLETIATQPEYVLPEPEAVERFTEEDLGAFLLRLTPEQRALVDQDRRGPILVKGGPGTGKSTLALYRVQRLLDAGVNRILFTTYTNALVVYSEQLLHHLLGQAPAERGVKVSTVDSLAAHYYARGFGWPSFATEGQALELLDQALREADIPSANTFDRRVRLQSIERLGRAYVLQEFQDVIEAWGISSADAYCAVERHGRRTPLRATVRVALWAVYSRWRDLMREHGLVLNEQLRRGALEVATALETKPFEALIIDEAQDLSPVALRFLLALVDSPEHVYLAADANQSLYQRAFSWRQIHADLHMAGRTIVLTRNYRNTAQIIAASQALLGPTADEGSPTHAPSPHEGDVPTVQLIDWLEDEAAAIHAFFSAAARAYHLPVHSGAVLCARQHSGRALAQQLTALGLPASFQTGKSIDITAQHVNVLTLHSAKGLEFPFVAIVGLDQGRMPYLSDDLPPEEVDAEIDEQRRLLYVGCTRAMRALLLVGDRSAPSPFLALLAAPLWQRKDCP